MHHIIPHTLRSNGPKKESESSHSGTSGSGAPWRQQESPKPISISEIVDHNQLGHSARLRVDDFELIKTLGTGAYYPLKLRDHLVNNLSGTFARVWLVRLARPKDGDDGSVYALKVLRKVDGMESKGFLAGSYADSVISHSTEASGTCPQRAKRAQRSCWLPIHYHYGRQLLRS